jgi:hypothetical protein
VETKRLWAVPGRGEQGPPAWPLHQQ